VWDFMVRHIFLDYGVTVLSYSADRTEQAAEVPLYDRGGPSGAYIEHEDLPDFDQIGAAEETIELFPGEPRELDATDLILKLSIAWPGLEFALQDLGLSEHKYFSARGGAILIDRQEPSGRWGEW
jgi:hypothetical protein